jgi:uncharacterized iron-regulated membrane protein
MSNLASMGRLLVGWILYAMFLTGTVSYFKEEITQWMRALRLRIGRRRPMRRSRRSAWPRQQDEIT